MKKKTNLMNGLLSCMFLAGGLTLVGCSTDDSIDVGDVDTTLGLGTDGLKAPAGYTNPIPLSDILDIDNSDCIVTDAAGNYKFVKDGGDIAETTTQIDPVKVETGSGITDIPYVIPVADLIPAGTIPSFPSRKATAPALTELKHTITAFDFHQAELSGDIVELKTAKTTPTHVKLTVTFSNDLSRLLSSFSGVELQLPGFLHFVDNKLDWTNGNASGSQVLDDEGWFKVGTVNTNQLLTLEGYVDALDFGGERIVSQSSPDKYSELLYSHNDRSIDMHGFIDIKIKFDQATVTTGLTNFSLEELANIGEKEFRIDSHLEFGNYDASFGQTVINLASVVGEFKPSIDFTIDAVEITDVPDFLKDDDAQIVINDVILSLDVESNLPLTGIIDGTLFAYYTNSKNMVKKTQIAVKGMTVKPNDKTHIVIRRQGAPSDFVFIADGSGKDSRVTGDIRDLLTNIPDSITFACTATTKDGEEADLPLGQQFRFKPSYSFEAPLTLDIGSRILYDDQVDDMNGDLNDDDYALYENAVVDITAVVENNTPLNLIVDRLKVLDLNGNELSGARAAFVNDALLEQPTFTAVHDAKTPVHILVTVDNDASLKKIDGLKYKVWAEAGTNGVQLNSNTQTVQFTNIKIDIKGKAKVDL